MNNNGMMINIKSLKPHPRNTEIYGAEDIKNLAEKIEKSGFIKPLIINTNNIIISGHRRYYSALKLGIEEVPYEIIVFNNENEELERLLLENEYREKTTYQKVQEAKLWETIEKEKARVKQLSGLNNQNIVKDNSPKREEGQTRDIVAKKVGIGSGKTLERAKTVDTEIEKLSGEGKEKDAEFLKTILNESVSGAKEFVKSDSLDKISDDIKDKVINKEITVKKAVQEIKKENEKVDQSLDTENSSELENHIDKAEDKNEVSEPEIKETIPVNNPKSNLSINSLQSNLELFIKDMCEYNEEVLEPISIDKRTRNKILDSIESLEKIVNEIKDMIISK